MTSFRILFPHKETISAANFLPSQRVLDNITLAQDKSLNFFRYKQSGANRPFEFSTRRMRNAVSCVQHRTVMQGRNMYYHGAGGIMCLTLKNNHVLSGSTLCARWSHYFNIYDGYPPVRLSALRGYAVRVCEFLSFCFCCWIKLKIYLNC